MNRITPSLLALTIFLAACPWSAARTTTPHAQVDRLLPKWVGPTTPGCAVAVIKDGQVIYQKTCGMADLDAKKPIDADTLFDLATLSRHFTAAAAVWLIDNGAVRPTDNIRVTIPEMPRIDPPITFDNLIHHTSGLPPYMSVWKKAGTPPIEDTLAMVDLLADSKPKFAPGRRFEISTSDYLLLGFLAQRVTSASLAEWSQNVIFKPAGMTHSVFSDHPAGLPAARAAGYKAKPFGAWKQVNNPLPQIAGDTGLWTTIGDLVIWEKTLMEKKTFSPRFYEVLQAPGKTNDGRPIEYAAGLTIGTYRDSTIFEHNGAQNGFSAGLLRFPTQNLAIVCVSNVESLKTRPLLHKIADLYLEN